MRTRTPVIIFSAETSEETAEANESRTIQAKAALTYLNIPFKQVVGSYKGVNETAFVVADKYRKHVLEIADWFTQEWILLLDANRNATLLYLDDGRTEELGRFREVLSDSLPESYTRDPETGQVWSVF